MILILGLGSAIAVYLTAAPDDPSAYDPTETKEYLRQMEALGGKASIFAAELTHWFESLWHGRSLAFTLAAIAVFSAAAFRFLAGRLWDGE